MQITFKVNIHADKKPIFPKKCFVCKKEVGLIKFKISEQPSGFFGNLKWILFLFNDKVEIFACRDCGSRFKRNNLLRTVWPIILVFPLVFISIFYFELSRNIGVIFLVLLFLPLTIFRIFNPIPFEYQKQFENFCYEFKDKEYAREFAKLNGVEFKDYEDS